MIIIIGFQVPPRAARATRYSGIAWRRWSGGPTGPSRPGWSGQCCRICQKGVHSMPSRTGWTARTRWTAGTWRTSRYAAYFSSIKMMPFYKKNLIRQNDLWQWKPLNYRPIRTTGNLHRRRRIFIGRSWWRISGKGGIPQPSTSWLWWSFRSCGLCSFSCGSSWLWWWWTIDQCCQWWSGSSLRLRQTRSTWTSGYVVPAFIRVVWYRESSQQYFQEMRDPQDHQVSRAAQDNRVAPEQRHRLHRSVL